MNVFRKLWQSIETLAPSLNGLGVTVDAFNQEVKQRSGVGVDNGPPLLTNDNELAALPSGKCEPTTHRRA
jgi:hypothetical protein